MHSQRVLSFFFTNITGAPHGEVFGLMNPLSNSSCTWTLSSCNSTRAILCGVIEMGEVPGCNLSRPRSRFDPIGESEPFSGCETIYWDSLFFFIFLFFYFFKLNLYLWYTNNFCSNQQSFTFTKILPPEWYPLKFIHIY